MTTRLLALSPLTIRALAAGQDDWAADHPDLRGVAWPAEDRRMLSYRIEALEADQAAAPFLLHVALEDGTFVGRIGCHTAPDSDGTVEIGYAVVPAARGRGVGARIVALFLDWLSDMGVSQVEASVSPDNEASLRLLRRHGFTEIGDRWDDEDGFELVLSRQLEPQR